jgi:hypothetical protein
VRAGLGVTVATRTSAATFMSAGGLCMVPLTATGQFLTWHAVIRSTRERGVAPRLVADALAEIVGAPGVTRPSYPVVRRPRRRSNT